ncbi:unnamed protein product [Prorocentrum cordatum]|uniref:Uncharacterized protein n=1 Tax=Prorocentrum cordatum TaxID=2364126 RepID=A0ABN9UQF0_9DINO|nr:unnamed protein product [Polarella glacialis]
MSAVGRDRDGRREEREEERGQTDRQRPPPDRAVANNAEKPIKHAPACKTKAQDGTEPREPPWYSLCFKRGAREERGGGGTTRPFDGSSWPPGNPGAPSARRAPRGPKTAEN